MKLEVTNKNGSVKKFTIMHSSLYKVKKMRFDSSILWKDLKKRTVEDERL